MSDGAEVKGRRFAKEVILLCVCWYVAYPTDGTISVIGTKATDKEQLTIDGVAYYCLVYSGNIYTQTCELKAFGTHQILSKSLVTRPSELKGDDVILISASFNDFCCAL